MVKSPRIRHSKPSRDPVTIDLEATEVEAKDGDAGGRPATVSTEAERNAPTQSPTVSAVKSGQSAAGQGISPASTMTDEEPGGGSGWSSTSTGTPPIAPDGQRSESAVGEGKSSEPTSRSGLGTEKTSAKSADAATAFGREPGKAQASPSGASASDADGAETSYRVSGAAGSSAFGREAGKASSAPGSPPPPAGVSTRPDDGSPPRRIGVSGVMAGLVGAIVALLGAGAMQLAGILPSPSAGPGDPAQVAELQAEVAALRQQVQALPAQGTAPGLAERVEALATALDEAKAEFAAAGGANADPAAAQALNERFAALEAAIADLPRGEAGSTPVDLAPVNEKIVALETSIADAGRAAAGAAKAAADAAAAAQAATDRVAQVEETITGISARLDEQAEQPQAALAIAASALKAAIDRGEPFTTELDTFAAVAPDAAEAEPLRAMAEAGVPSRTQIAADFDAAAAAMLAAGRSVDPNAGFIDKLMSSAQSLVQVRPVGDVEGEAAPAAIARIEVAIDKGDYAAALKEYETLPEASKAAGADYAAKLRARLAADELMDRVLAAALKA